MAKQSQEPANGSSLKPWEIRPKSDIGSADSNEVYQAVGMALTSWEYVESALADIFALMVGASGLSPPRDPATRAYGSVASFNSRVGMLEAAAQGYFELTRSEAKDDKVRRRKNEMRGEFDRLVKVAARLAERRNNIAHGIVRQRRGGRGHFLTPPLYATKKYPMKELPTLIWDRAAYAFTADDIHHYREQFEDIYDKLSILISEFREASL